MSPPECMASRNPVKATASCSISSSARSRMARARLLTSAAPLQLSERMATFWIRAAEAATTAAAADPLAGAGAPEAILFRR
jgi:hypothetical protein